MSSSTKAKYISPRKCAAGAPSAWQVSSKPHFYRARLAEAVNFILLHRAICDRGDKIFFFVPPPSALATILNTATGCFHVRVASGITAAFVAFDGASIFWIFLMRLVYVALFRPKGIAQAYAR